MALKFYAVRKGRATGIFNTWDECKNQVFGFAGAEYKSFKTLDEANAYLANKKDDAAPEDSSKCMVYVDGSYNDSLKIFGSGIVIINCGEVLKFSKTFEDEDLVSMRNVAGEIKGAMFAMEYAVSNNIDEIYLFYDYAGIEKWCIGEWKTNKCGTVEYKKFYDGIKDKLVVHFVKVQAHTGVLYNEMADKLAKEGAKI